MSEARMMERELRRERREAEKAYQKEMKELHEQVAEEAMVYRAMHK